MRIPLPKYEEPEEIILARVNEERIRQFLDVPNWKCECRGVMMGRVKLCVYCKKPRPEA